MPASPDRAARLAGSLLAFAFAVAVALAPTARAATVTYVNPVVPGNHPDPSVIRAGDGYWLTATSRGWAPIFPLLRSDDLVSWERVGAVLSAVPRWAAGPFWAPELIAWDDGTTRVYYTARLRRDRRRPCIGVATAPAPGGRYRDIGRPLLCGADGAIDPFVATDEHGGRALLYRRFHGTGGIWARPLRADGLGFTGRERLLLAVTPADLGVVEGPAVARHGDAFVLLFASGNCCRPPCDYAQGVARAPSLYGPYVRAPRLALVDGDALRCPGHGTLVEDAAGAEWFVHHAVLPDDPHNQRRHAVLTPVAWDADGWPVLGDGGRPAGRAVAPAGAAPQRNAPLAPDLAAPTLDPGWEWPWRAPAHARASRDGLALHGDPRGATLARQVPPVSWRAHVRVRARGCAAGIAAVQGDRDAAEAIGIEHDGAALRTWRGTAGGGAGRTLATAAFAARGPVTVAVTVRDGRWLRFAARAGARRVAVGGWVATPPTRRAIRVALTCRGARGGDAVFSALHLRSGR